METINILLRDVKFWVALLFFIRTILFYAVPNFPEQIWAAFDAFIAVILGILSGNNVMQTKKTRAAARAVAATNKE